jgi:hypothetical protein
MILKRELIPIQDDRENVRERGGLRSDATTHAKRRSADPGTDPRVPRRQSCHRIQRPEPGRAVQICGTSFSGSGVCRARQEAAGDDPLVLKQSHRAQRAANDAVDSQVLPGGRDRGGSVSPEAFPGRIYGSRPCGVGQGGSRARLAQRAGHGTHTQAGIRAVRARRVCATGGAIGLPSVQLAARRGVSETGCPMGADAAQRHRNRRAAETRSARAAGFSAWTRCIKETGRGSKGCITSTLWTR